MPAPTRSPQARPHSTPAYYLARPASTWITALHPRPRHSLTRPPVGPAGAAPAGPAAV
jgi:hypothetical protein